MNFNKTPLTDLLKEHSRICLCISISILLHLVVIYVFYFLIREQNILVQLDQLDVIAEIDNRIVSSKKLIKSNHTISQSPMISNALADSNQNINQNAKIGQNLNYNLDQSIINNFVHPKIMGRVVFNRTEQARRMRYEGNSKLKVSIDKLGQVIDVVLLNDLPYGLNDKSIEIVRNINFSPAYLAGEPIEYEFVFTIQYRNE